jgi:hypothetical protein
MDTIVVFPQRETEERAARLLLRDKLPEARFDPKQTFELSPLGALIGHSGQRCERPNFARRRLRHRINSQR